MLGWSLTGRFLGPWYGLGRFARLSYWLNCLETAAGSQGEGSSWTEVSKGCRVPGKQFPGGTHWEQALPPQALTQAATRLLVFSFLSMCTLVSACSAALLFSGAFILPFPFKIQFYVEPGL